VTWNSNLQALEGPLGRSKDKWNSSWYLQSQFLVLFIEFFLFEGGGIY